ncbi:CapA family protein [Streptomyces sp. NPDC002328]|uniref:CapA family protein n=1 Tax=Streptomyces sp. NPDC002328 TaxID=3364642 RepID=UPI00369D2B1E
MSGSAATLFLCGDVMLGRGVDQILPHPGSPELREDFVRDARSYVRLAEAVNGPVPAPVDPAWPWGAALPWLAERDPDVRILNLETSVTRGNAFALDKAVHYRMHPANLPALAVARPDVCVLANNHVLDFGRPGLEETLVSLRRAGLRTAGAGRGAEEAYAPAVTPLPSGGRVLVFALGSSSAGIPPSWAATPGTPGIAYVPELSAQTAAAVVRHVRRAKRPGDIAVVSVHWGSNWGYRVPREQIRFARLLVDGGVDLVHGHSSHHPRRLEVYRDRLVLHGCGDFVDDYEGISGYEEYRDDLRIAYLVTLAAGGPDAADPGRLTGLRMLPLKARRLRLEPAPRDDRAWLRNVLVRVSDGVHITADDSEADGSLVLVRSPAPARGGTGP